LDLQSDIDLAGNIGAEAAPVVQVKSLHAKIDELTLENDFFPVRSAKPGF
jgi:hypothetical protein